MRSLEYWTKYLEEQEQALQDALQRNARSKQPGHAEEQAESASPESAAGSRIAPAEPPAAPGPSRPEIQAAIRPPASADAVRPAEPRPVVRLGTKLPQASEAGDGRKVVQESSKRLEETRGELLQRLLDPQISLEEAARILNVCPTTVRRYTNRGLLKHFRTPGNQRRFRLSDVLAFLESQTSGRHAAD